MDTAASYSFFKQDVRQWAIRNFPPEATILDVGAGSGTYYNLLHEDFNNIEAVEAWKPVIDHYNLEGKYTKVHHIDIKDFTYDHYDLIIFGDVLEHLTVAEAQKVLEYALPRCENLIVALPYNYPQANNDNLFEEHKQPDLTIENVAERYPQLQLLYGNHLYGYYIKK